MTALLPAIAAVGALYVLYRYYLPFGGRPDAARKARARASANHDGKKFTNYIATPMDFTAGDMGSMLRDQLRNDPASRPSRPLELAYAPLQSAAAMPQVTWLGHSTILLHMNGHTLLFDPIFSNAASPVQAVGPKRFKAVRPITLAELPPVDIVCISHDHYDHLDYHTVKQLAKTAKMFFVPLGVGAHMERWGVSPACITELDWWQESSYAGMTFACTPARHFSGRTLTDRFRTLWCSWVVSGGAANVFFSGDTGYGPHFARIGERYGPFDLALLECGQYDRRWPNVHMTPEQTATAFADLHARRLLPMHWGTFKLAFHGWSESVERVIRAARHTDPHAQVATPRIGQTITVTGKTYPIDPWWEAYKT